MKGIEQLADNVIGSQRDLRKNLNFLKTECGMERVLNFSLDADWTPDIIWKQKLTRHRKAETRNFFGIQVHRNEVRQPPFLCQLL